LHYTSSFEGSNKKLSLNQRFFELDIFFEHFCQEKSREVILMTLAGRQEGRM
jgi:hypothetical protein